MVLVVFQVTLASVYSNLKCENVQVFLVIDPPFTYSTFISPSTALYMCPVSSMFWAYFVVCLFVLWPRYIPFVGFQIYVLCVQCISGAICEI
jgi:hypothetical protein